jgi:predicted transcriptional regulator
MTLEKAGLISYEIRKASKGNQKICKSIYDEYIIAYQDKMNSDDEIITVEMPVGLFIEYDISSPCGMCTSTKIVGYLYTPESLLEPERRASLNINFLITRIIRRNP